MSTVFLVVYHILSYHVLIDVQGGLEITRQVRMSTKVQNLQNNENLSRGFYRKILVRLETVPDCLYKLSIRSSVIVS